MGILFGKCFDLIYKKKVDEIKIQDIFPKTIIFNTKELKFISYFNKILLKYIFLLSRILKKLYN